jgi:hypothetical protein
MPARTSSPRRSTIQSIAHGAISQVCMITVLLSDEAKPDLSATGGWQPYVPG